jgi:hypothetical protein
VVALHNVLALLELRVMQHQRVAALLYLLSWLLLAGRLASISPVVPLAPYPPKVSCASCHRQVRLAAVACICGCELCSVHSFECLVCLIVCLYRDCRHSAVTDYNSPCAALMIGEHAYANNMACTPVARRRRY